MEHSISKDLLLMLTDADDHNVIIQVGENQNTRDFRAHSNILRARSHYFQIALSKKWVTKRNNEDVVKYKKPNIDPGVFEIILRYIYTDEADLSEKSGTDIFKLLIASDELLLEKLFKYIQDYLIENRNIFYSLLKRDDLHIDEVIAWNHLIKWGINQIPLLKSDRDKWNETDYEDLKKAISQFIPLIRFSEISRADFYDNVRPYKAVISHNVYEEMMKFYMKDIPPISIISTPRVRRPLNKLIKAQKPFLPIAMKTVKGSVRWNPY
ncbi:unnamed protein product [Rhizophagus irregularis]|nr:unnamed protein product [Rhizophagus irregularis]